MKLLNNLRQRLITTLKLAFAKGVFHLIFSLGFVQGSVFIVQFIVARLLSPEDFGYVKVIDTTLGMVLVLATVGMPSAIAKYVPEVDTAETRGKVLFQVLVIGLISALVISSLTFFSLELLPLSGPVVRSLEFLVWSLILTTLSRTIINYYQGKKQIQRMAVINVILAILTLILVTALTALWQFDGWIIGKFASEVVFLVGMFLLVRGEIVIGWSASAAKRLFTFGSFAALSLLVWRIQATADVLYLDVLLRDAAQIGYYGVASLAMSALLLIPAAIGAAAFPYLSERSTNIQETLSLTLSILRNVALLMFGLCVLTYVVGPPVLLFLLGPKYAPAGILIKILMPAAFIGAILSILGNFLFAIEGAQFTLAVNIVAALVNLGLNYFLIPRWGVAGTAWAMVITQAIQLVLYTGIILYLRRPGVTYRRTVITVD